MMNVVIVEAQVFKAHIVTVLEIILIVLANVVDKLELMNVVSVMDQESYQENVIVKKMY